MTSIWKAKGTYAVFVALREQATEKQRNKTIPEKISTSPWHEVKIKWENLLKGHVSNPFEQSSSIWGYDVSTTHLRNFCLFLENISPCPCWPPKNKDLQAFKTIQQSIPPASLLSSCGIWKWKKIVIIYLKQAIELHGIAKDKINLGI